jgi:hypothetical protein
MNINLETIIINAFKDELQKLAAIEVDKEGRVIYHSKDQDNPKKKLDETRSGYEMYSEDSAGGTQELQTQPSPQ